MTTFQVLGKRVAMRGTDLVVMLMIAITPALHAQGYWQEITSPTTREVAEKFETPPRQYGAIHWAIWGGDLTQERITREFDALSKMGMYVVNLGPARGMP